MTSKERVFAMLKGEKNDRAPRYIWVSPYTAENLCNYYGITPDQLDNRLGNDIKQSWLSINREMERECAQGECFTDEWGNVWKRDGYYNAVIKHALSGLTAEEIREYPVPDVFAPDRFEIFDRLVKEYGDTHFIGADVSGTLFEPAYHLRGMEDFLMDMMLEEDAADVLLDKLTAHSKAIAIEAIKRGADWIWLGDDMGTQISMIMSPDLWRKYFKPRMKDIIDTIRKEKPEIPIAYHSCGAISPILPDLIEIGIDVINPLQESATGMNHDEIRKLFGNKTTMFCGLDTQTFMVNAADDEIRKATKSMLERLGKNGKFLVGVSHTLQPDVPVENIVAMIETLDCYSADN